MILRKFEIGKNPLTQHFLFPVRNLCRNLFFKVDEITKLRHLRKDMAPDSIEFTEQFIIHLVCSLK